MDLYSLDLDLDTDLPGDADEAELQLVAEDYAREAGGDSISVRILALHGPGGGVPSVRFVGPQDQLQALQATHWDDDDVEDEVRLLTFDEAEAEGRDGTGRGL